MANRDGRSSVWPLRCAPCSTHGMPCKHKFLRVESQAVWYALARLLCCDLQGLSDLVATFNGMQNNTTHQVRGTYDSDARIRVRRGEGHQRAAELDFVWFGVRQRCVCIRVSQFRSANLLQLFLVLSVQVTVTSRFSCGLTVCMCMSPMTI